MQFSGLFWWEGHGPEHEETQAPAVWASNGLCASTASIVFSSVLSILFPLNSIGFLGSLDAHVRLETLFLRTCISPREVCYFVKLSCVYRKPLRERRAIEGEKKHWTSWILILRCFVFSRGHLLPQQVWIYFFWTRPSKNKSCVSDMPLRGRKHMRTEFHCQIVREIYLSISISLSQK